MTRSKRPESGEAGIEPGTVSAWIEELGWETVVNRRSTTWKGLDESQRSSMDEQSALAAILEAPTLVKRPVLDTGSERLVGFKAELYQQTFSRHTL